MLAIGMFKNYHFLVIQDIFNISRWSNWQAEGDPRAASRGDRHQSLHAEDPRRQRHRHLL